MKRSFAVVMILVGGIILANVALAGDVDDIKKATLEHFVTLSTGNTDAHIDHHAVGHTTFAGDGGLLEVNDSLAEEKKSMQADFDAGVKLNLRITHLDVTVYGNTAVVTGYVVGTTTDPEGTAVQAMTRRTAVLVKKDGAWKEVHLHSSPVVSPSE